MLHPVGDVYFINCVGTTFYKIGRAQYWTDRLRQLKGANPFDLNVIATFRHPNYKEIERHLQAMYIDHKVRGEWFDLDADAVASITKFLQAKDHALTKSTFMEVYL